MAAKEEVATLAREAVDRHGWHEARELLTEAARTAPLSPADLELLGEVEWWLGNLPAAIEAEEQAYAAYQKAGDPVSAARVALDLCTNYGMRGDPSMHMGWFRRAERLLEDRPESVEHGLLERRRAAAAFGSGDAATALEHARECEAIGMRLGDPTLQALGLHEQARAHILLGDVELGLAQMEEVVVAAVSGELEPRQTGVIYCNAINVCRDLNDYQRAGEWTAATKRWCERMAVSGFPGICRIRRAEITRLRGAWAEAEREARQAVEELRGYYVEIAAAGLYEIGEIRLRIGDLEAAEEAFRQANELGEDPQPGLAILRLRQGKVDAAAAAIRRALEETTDRLHRARLLPAQVEIAIQTGDLDLAERAAAELETVTETYTSAALRALAAVAGGRAQLARGEHEDAITSLRTARKLWKEVDAPYETAESRVLLGLAYRATGDEEAARLELEGARATYDTVGAVPDAARVDELLGGSPRRATATREVTRTFMFTDIEGSTQLVEAIGDAGWQELQRWHHETLRALFATHGGEVVDTAGDGFFVAFPDAEPAIESAVAIQRTLAEHRRAHGFAPRVRIGLHTAAARSSAEGYSGKGVHEAARVGALARGEEIVATAETIPPVTRFPVSAPTETELRGIGTPVSVVSVDWRT